MAATIRDVADRAGVTKAVVSATLNERHSNVRVSEGTRQRVRQAAEDLHYRPNVLARGLKRKYTDTIGIVPQFAGFLSVWSGFTSEMMQGVSAAAIREGYRVLLNFRHESGLDREVAAVTDGQIDGALLWRSPSDPMAQRLHECGFPVVMMFGPHDNPDVWYVDCDNQLGGRLATQHLLGLGHTRIAHLTTGSNDQYVLDRRAGYQEALYEAGLPVRPEWIVEVGWEKSGENNYAQIEALLHEPQGPTAVFAWYDGVALNLLYKARQWGLRVPEDLSIIGFDSTAQCLLTLPTLTSVRQPICEIADCATTLLVQRIRGEPVQDTRRIFTPTLDERGSCAPI
jgi:LacI family transcriptional regulator